ncbi:MAG: YunG family protein [Puniceicoccales bacterium]
MCGCSHYWNRLPEGAEVDLARDQFPAWYLTAQVETRTRTRLLVTARQDSASTAQRYQALLT